MRKGLIAEIIIIFLLVTANSIVVFGDEDVETVSAQNHESENTINTTNYEFSNFDVKRTELIFDRLEEMNYNFYNKKSSNFEVYLDSIGTEYYFSAETGILCGYLFENIGFKSEGGDCISEDNAIELAENILRKERTGDNYVLSHCVYNKMGNYYDIEYSYTVNGLKTDDIFRVWINTKGDITAFSEFNYNLYNNLQIDVEQYEKTRLLLIDKLNENIGVDRYEIYDSFISTDKENKSILVLVVDIMANIDNGNYIRREYIYDHIC